MEGMADFRPSQMRFVVQCSSHWPSVCPTASVSHSPSECRLAAPPAAGRSSCATSTVSLPAIPPRLGLTSYLFDPDAIHPGRSLVLAHPFPRRFQHIHPIDPVVQRVKSELRFLLGLLAQFLSQL